MRIRDAVEADAEALAALADAPSDVMRELVHDRTVRVAVPEDAPERTNGGGAEMVDPSAVRGFVSYDARDGVVHVTQFGGDDDACERLLAEPVAFGRRQDLPVEVLVPETETDSAAAVEAAGFDRDGTGPRFDGQSTVRYRAEP
ncbi:MAG: hypothetical protein ABEJ79_11075 [Halolamina sp.]